MPARDDALPAEPAERYMVFDGHCHLCSGWARFLGRHRVEPPFALIPMQSPSGQALLCLHGIDPLDPATFLVVDRGRVLRESDAAIHVVAVLGGAWRAIRLARLLPKTWRDWCYRFVARNRYRWFGRRRVCYVPH